MTIRFTKLIDAPAILAIYAPYVMNSAITFEYTVPSVSEFSERIQIIQQQFPFLVAEEDGQLLGYAYASRHRDRIAYQWAVETSVYIHPHGQRKGLARALYTKLFELLRRQGYYTACAGITKPNLQSETFHCVMGFESIGLYSNVGYKMGEWHSVEWFQLALQPHQLNPAKPIPVTRLT